VYLDAAILGNNIDQFIKELRHRINDFLESPRLTNWTPPESAGEETRRFYNDLAIPFVNNGPSLLLHDLGKYPSPYSDILFRFPHPTPKDRYTKHR